MKVKSLPKLLIACVLPNKLSGRLSTPVPPTAFYKIAIIFESSLGPFEALVYKFKSLF